MVSMNEQVRAAMGRKATDKLSGFTGMVYALGFWASSADRVCLKPLSLDKDGKVQEPEWLDLSQVTVEGDVLHEYQEFEELTVNLLDTVEDTVVKFSGKITAIGFWHTGCVRVAIQPDALHEGVPAEEAWQAAHLVEVVKRSKKPERPKRGGPTKAPRMQRDAH